MTPEEFEKKWGPVLDGKASWASVARPEAPVEQKTTLSAAKTGQQAARTVQQRRAVAATGAAPADTPTIDPARLGESELPPTELPARAPESEPEPTPAPVDPNSFYGRASKALSDVGAGLAATRDMFAPGAQSAASAIGGALGSVFVAPSQALRQQAQQQGQQSPPTPESLLRATLMRRRQ